MSDPWQAFDGDIDWAFNEPCDNGTIKKVRILNYRGGRITHLVDGRVCEKKHAARLGVR